MKRIKIALVVALVAMVSGLSVQAGFKIGPKVGLNVEKMHFNSKTFDGKNSCGFTVGVMGEYMIPGLGVGADLSLQYSRLKFNVDFDNQGEIYNKGLNYVEIPLNLKYKVNIPMVASIVKPMIFTGPTLSLLLKKDAFVDRTCQWGWNVGIGVELINHLQISGAYTFGINNIVQNFVESNEAGNIKDIKVKNNYWMVSAAWLF